MGGCFLSLDCSLVSQPVHNRVIALERREETQTRKVRNRIGDAVKDDLNFARRGKEFTYISVSIWNTLLFPLTSDLIYRMK